MNVFLTRCASVVAATLLLVACGSSDPSNATSSHYKQKPKHKSESVSKQQPDDEHHRPSPVAIFGDYRT